jgi:hypothetical protein
VTWHIHVIVLTSGRDASPGTPLPGDLVTTLFFGRSLDRRYQPRGPVWRVDDLKLFLLFLLALGLEAAEIAKLLGKAGR